VEQAVIKPELALQHKNICKKKLGKAFPKAHTGLSLPLSSWLCCTLRTKIVSHMEQ